MKFVLKVLVIALIYVYSLTAQVTGLDGWNICLDPGHSRTENMGIYGYSEAEKNLRVGLRLLEFLMNTTDIDTVYITRTNDIEIVSLSARTDYANSVGAAWFHSIHSDAGSPQYNSTLLLWGQLYDGTPDPPVGGEDMSDIMVDILTRGMRTNTRGSIGDCSFYAYTGACSPSWPGPYLHVNRMTDMPSELSEAGFHTNPTQNQLNMNAEWKKLEAKTFYWSILKYHDIDRPFVGTCVGIISNSESGVPINGAQVSLNGQTYTTDTFESLFHNYTNDPDLLHNGFYYFENLPDDTLEMIVEAEGFYSDTSQVVVVDTFFTFRDVELVSSVPPYVVSTTPVQGDTSFPVNMPVIINFSRHMDPAATNPAFSISPPVEGTIGWSQGHTRLHFYHSVIMEYTTYYTVVIDSSARDVYGHPLDGNGDGVGGDSFILTFRTTGEDVVAPVIVQTHPPNLASGIYPSVTINIEFDEALDQTTIIPEHVMLEDAAQEPVPRNIFYCEVGGHSVIMLQPADILLANSNYTVILSNAIADLNGNHLAASYTFTFNTGREPAVAQVIDDFETGVGYWWEPEGSGSTTGILDEETNFSSDDSVTNPATGSTHSAQLTYHWATDSLYWLLREHLSGGPPRSVHFDTSYTLQVYLFGDGSNNLFRFCVDDHVPASAVSYHEVSPWVTIDWIGWRLVEWDLGSDPVGTWIGNGILEGTLRIDSFQLTYDPVNGAEQGVVYFDDLRLTRGFLGVPFIQVSTPTTFALYQNYPNPFNPTTTIKYQLPTPGWVTLKVYNMIGQEVRTLVNQPQLPGVKRVTWDGRDNDGNPVTSGVYIYTLKTKEFRDSKKMIFLK